MSLHYIVPCLFGLEGLAAQELRRQQGEKHEAVGSAAGPTALP